ncbi:ubiquitin, partial [Coccidioides posadasii str. Silveira]
MPSGESCSAMESSTSRWMRAPDMGRPRRPRTGSRRLAPKKVEEDNLSSANGEHAKLTKFVSQAFVKCRSSSRPS